MSGPPPPEEGIDTSFWAWAYAHQPGPLLATLTDVSVHRFELTNMLHTFSTLQDTPFLHDPFQEQVPIQLIERYRTHMNMAETQVRRALNIVDTIGHFPARAFLHDPTIDINTHPTEPHIHPIFPLASTLAPGQPVTITNNIPYRLPTTPILTQHSTTQTSPPFPPLLLHQQQQTTPPPRRLHIEQQTDPVIWAGTHRVGGNIAFTQRHIPTSHLPSLSTLLHKPRSTPSHSSQLSVGPQQHARTPQPPASHPRQTNNPMLTTFSTVT